MSQACGLKPGELQVFLAKAKRTPYSAFSGIEPTNLVPDTGQARRRRLRRAITRMLRTEVAMPADEFEDNEDEITAWLVENVGPRRREHLLHVAIDGSTRNGDAGCWEQGRWGNYVYVWFTRKQSAALFILMFGGAPTMHDDFRRTTLLQWATFK